MEKTKIISKTTIIDTRNVDYDEFIPEFKDYCEDNGYTVVGEGTEMKGLYLGGKVTFNDWVNDCIETEVEDFWSNLKSYCQKSKCLVSGTLGLWYGTRKVSSPFETLYDACVACSKDAYYIDVYVENDVIYFDAYHHDGVNSFEIYLLNDTDYVVVDNWDKDFDSLIDYAIEHKNEVYFENFGM